MTVSLFAFLGGGEARPVLTAPRSFVMVRGPSRGIAMVSSSQQFDRIRKRKQTTAGKRNKRDKRRLGTPAFPIHQAGYSTSAADSKPAKA